MQYFIASSVLTEGTEIDFTALLTSYANHVRFNVKQCGLDPDWTCPRCQNACVCPACRRKREQVKEPSRRSSSRVLSFSKPNQDSRLGSSRKNSGLPKNRRSGRKIVIKGPKIQRLSEISEGCVSSQSPTPSSLMSIESSPSPSIQTSSVDQSPQLLCA